jgi:hypothetical protein
MSPFIFVHGFNVAHDYFFLGMAFFFGIVELGKNGHDRSNRCEGFWCAPCKHSSWVPSYVCLVFCLFYNKYILLSRDNNAVPY